MIASCWLLVAGCWKKVCTERHRDPPVGGVAILANHFFAKLIIKNRVFRLKTDRSVSSS
jgi:hypothetical protein